MDDLALNYFINWALYAIFGRMDAADSILKRYRQHIYRAADLLRNKYRTKAVTLYRGVLLEPEFIKDNLIASDYPVEFISFSESRDVACWFADTASIMSGFVKEQRPRVNGYLVEHTPEASDILFHYGWTDIVKFLVHAAGMHPDIDVSQFKWNVITQKEVIIKPTSSPLTATLYVGDRTKELDDALCHPFFRHMF